MAALPPQCRRVYLLRKVYGLSHKDIAKRMGIAVSTVEKHLIKECDRYVRARNEFIDRDAVEAQAREWLVRLDGDSPLAPADREALQRWAAQSPVHRQELLRIAAFWSEAELLAELATPQRKLHARWNLGLTRLWQVVSTTPRAAITGALALVVAAALLTPLSRSDIAAFNGLYATNVGEQREQLLSDGSVVEINTDSEVQVAYSNERRLLRLVRGEAHFKVAHDTRRPFDVYAGTSLIRATGTAFSVHMQGGDVTVTVAEGSVALGTLAALPQESEISAPLLPLRVTLPMLRPLKSGHIARVHENIADVRALDTEDLAREFAWREGLLVFTGDPLSQVIDEVSRYTSIRIEIADARLRTLPVGGRFRLGDVDAMLDALESSFGIRVLRLDERHIQLLAAPPEHI